MPNTGRWMSPADAKKLTALAAFLVSKSNVNLSSLRFETALGRETAAVINGAPGPHATDASSAARNIMSWARRVIRRART